MMEHETLDLAAQWVAKAEQDFLAVQKLTVWRIFESTNHQ